MKRSLLDSVILIDHFNGVEASTHYLSRHALNPAISVITRAEVLAGFAGSRKTLAMRLLDRLETLPLTAREANLAADLRRDESWKLPDALQAAVALYNGLQLITRNTKDFDPSRYPFVSVPYETSS